MTVPSGSTVSRTSFLSAPITTDSCSFTRYTWGVHRWSLPRREGADASGEREREREWMRMQCYCENEPDAPPVKSGRLVTYVQVVCSTDMLFSITDSRGRVTRVTYTDREEYLDTGRAGDCSPSASSPRPSILLSSLYFYPEDREADPSETFVPHL
jgi:hypothetical protein